jgi:hypothetical protein
MVGCIRDKEGRVLHVGTSQNHPRVNINQHAFVEANRVRRRKFVGDVLWKYDAAIEDEITNNNPDPITNLSQHIATRQILKGPEWVVVRGQIHWQNHYPSHYEPRCFAYISSLLSSHFYFASKKIPTSQIRLRENHFVNLSTQNLSLMPTARKRSLGVSHSGS